MPSLTTINPVNPNGAGPTAAQSAANSNPNPNAGAFNVVGGPATNPDGSKNPYAAAPTVADIYGGAGSLDDQAAAAAAAKTAAYDPATIAKTEGQARSDVLTRYQSQIDALDQAAAEARARITTAFAPIAAGRVGSATATEARRGLLGSDFGNAQTDQVNNQNTTDLNNQIAASDAIYANQRTNLMQFIDGEVDKEVGIRNDASQKGADAKIAEIQGRQERAQTSAQASVKAMIAAGITDSTNPNYGDAITKIASNTGLTKDQVTGLFTDAKKANDDAQLKSQQDAANLAKTKAETGAILTPEQVAADEKSKQALTQSEIAKNKADAAQIYANMSTTDINAAASWVANIKAGTAKLADVPKNLKNAVSDGLAKSGSSTADLLKTTQQSLQELNNMVDQNHGFTASVGANIPNPIGFFTDPLDQVFAKGLPGSQSADFIAKLKQVKNDVILPNLTILHGLGRVTDREFQALTSAVTALDTNLSEGQFKTELKDITDRINSKIAESNDTDQTGDNSTSTATSNVDLSGFNFKF
jgi:hypothetical protein